MNKLLIYILIGVLLTSCFKEDDPYPPFDAQTTTIEMGQYYQHQIYFDLASNEVISINDKNNWDLGFQNGDSSFRILLNTSAFVLAANTGFKDFEQATDTAGLTWHFDKSDGNMDSTAIGEWFVIDEQDTSYNYQVYILDRGYDHLGNLRGFKKVVFTHVDSVSYSFHYANLDGSDENNFTVNKSSGVFFTHFSFDEGGHQLETEPRFDSWDLIFTQYTTLLYTSEGDPYPYLVTGVLSNPNHIKMAMDSILDFDLVDSQYARSLDFSNNRDHIGYDWKELIGDVNSGNVYYEIVQGRNYLVKTNQGLIFKIRFVNFYSNTGEKGYPSFQYEVL